jgi:hypothetical protein
MGRALIRLRATALYVLIAILASGLKLGACAPELVDCHPRGSLNIALALIFATWLLVAIGMIRSRRKNVQ